MACSISSRWAVLLSLFVTLVNASAVLGATYYVRATGNNANNGTSPATAWAQVSYADSQAQAGDIVYVGAGSYSGQVEPTNSGTALNPIRFIADTTGAHTGDAGTVTIQQTNGVVLRISQKNYIRFEGFTITRTSTSSETVFIEQCDGIVLTNCTVSSGRYNLYLTDPDATFTNCTFSSANRDAVRLTDGSATFNNCTITGWGSSYDGIWREGAGTLTVSQCLIHTGGDAIYGSGGDIDVINTIIRDVTGAGIRTTSSSPLDVVNCTFADIGLDGIEFEATTRIYNCIFAYIGDDCMDCTAGTVTDRNNLCHSYASERSENFTSHSSELVADPLFVNHGTNDFRLLSTSPAIDSGSAYTSFTSVDYIGTSRPQGAAWDRGAYEYVMVITPANVPYTQTFESSPSLLEWDYRTTESVSPLTTYLGRLSNASTGRTSATLYLNTTVGQAYTLLVDPYLIDSWDGEQFRISINGTQVYSATWTFGSMSSSNQSLLDRIDLCVNIGYGSWVESLFRNVRVDFTATQAITQIAFTNTLNQAYDDEAVGIDNVRVMLTANVASYLPRFTPVGIQTDFDYQSTTAEDGSSPFWGDLNNDGYLDAIVTGNSTARRVMNDGDGTFTTTNLSVGQMYRQGALVDLDNDGDLDFYGLATSANERFCENNGSASFTDAGALGFANPSNSEGIAAADVDDDGWCDLVVFSENGNWIGFHDGESPMALAGTTTSSYGLNDAGDYGNGDQVSSADVNNDGYLDFFYHYGGGKLFVSNGDGTYTQNNFGIAVNTDNNDKMGSAWGDYDNDGDMDLFVCDSRAGQTGTLWRNDRNWTTSTGNFSSVASAAGISSTGAQRGCAWGDMDNDGDLDLYIVTEGSWANNRLYRNNGNGTFTEVAVSEYARAPGNGHDAVFVDYDNDGDLDIAVTQQSAVNTLLRNETGGTNYLKVRVQGAGSGRTNKAAIGTRVELWNASGTVRHAIREIGTARGLGQEPLWVHFGGTTQSTTYTVKVRYPGGSEFEVQVTPQVVSTTIGAVTIPRMLTIDQTGEGVRAVRWRETAPFD